MLRANGTMSIQNVRKLGDTWMAGASVTLMVMVDKFAMRTKVRCIDCDACEKNEGSDDNRRASFELLSKGFSEKILSETF